MKMDEKTLFLILAGWILLMSIILFCMMGADKRRAQNDKWRIKERTLFITAFLGGGLGGVLGMQIFRHKTKHTSFMIGMPLLLLWNIAAAFAIMHFFGQAS